MDYNSILVTSDDAKKCMMNISSMLYEEYSKLTNKDTSVEEMLAYYAGNKYNKTLDSLIKINDDVDVRNKLVQDYERCMSDVMKKNLGSREWWNWWVGIGHLSIVVMVRDYMTIIKNLQLVPNIHILSRSRSCLNSTDPVSNWWVDLDNIIKAFNYILSGDTRNRNFTDQSLRKFSDYYGGMMWAIVDKTIVDDTESIFDNYYTKDEVDEKIASIEVGDGVNVEDIETLKSDVITLQDDVSDLSDKVSDSTNTIYTLSSSVSTIETTVNTLSGTVSELSTDIDKTLEPITTSISELEGRVSTNETDINGLKSGLEDTQQDVSDLSDKVTDSINTIYTLSSKISTVSNTLDSLQDDVTTLEGNVGDINTEILNIDTRLDILENNSSDDVESVDPRVDDIIQDIEDINSVIYTQSSSINTLQTTTTNIQSELDTLESLVGSSVTNINNDISTLESRVSTNEDDIEDLKNQTSTSGTDIDNINDDITNIVSTIYVLANKIEEVEDSIPITYTKDEVDEKISSLDIPETDLSDYYTKEEVDEKFTELVEGDGFEEIVTDAVNSVIANLDEDTFATKVYVDEAIESIEIPEVDLSEYYTKEEIDTSITTERIQVGTVHIYETTKEDDGVTVPAGYIYTERGNIYTTKGNIYTTDGDIYSSDGDVYSHTGNMYAEGKIYSRSGDFEAHGGSFYKGEGDERVEVVYKDEIDLLSYIIPEDVISSTTGTQEEILSRFGSQEEFDKFLTAILNNQNIYIAQGTELINVFSREINYSDKDEQTSIKNITLTFINSNGSKIQLLFTYNSDDETYSYTVDYINYTGDLNLWEMVNTEQGYIGRTTGSILSSDRVCDRVMNTYIPVIHDRMRIQIWNPNLIDNSEYDNLVDNPYETKHVGYIIFYDEDKEVVGLTYITTNLYDGTPYTMHGCSSWKDSKYMRIYLTVGSENPDNYTYDEDIKIMISWGSEIYDYRPSVADLQGGSVSTETIQELVTTVINEDDSIVTTNDAGEVSDIIVNGGEITF